jgi:DNA-binding transcriptional MerR regulator
MAGFAASSQVERLTVVALARQVGVGADTIRYYERVGLLPEPRRSAAGYRQYGSEAVDRVRFIRGCQRLGLRLREIQELLDVRDTGICTCGPAEVMLRRRVSELDAEMARLALLRQDLVHMVERIPGADCPDPSPGTWQSGGR